MIPYDSQSNPNDPVTWHMVQQQQHQLQYNETGMGAVPSTEVRIRILVGEKGRLGCGVCRGIVPGLTVQVDNRSVNRWLSMRRGMTIDGSRASLTGVN